MNKRAEVSVATKIILAILILLLAIALVTNWDKISKKFFSNAISCEKEINGEKQGQCVAKGTVCPVDYPEKTPDFPGCSSNKNAPDCCYKGIPT